MFINKAPNGKNNLCGANVARLRKTMGISQRELAIRLQIAGLDIEKNGIQRIEAGLRFVTDIELTFLSKVLAVEIETLLAPDNRLEELFKDTPAPEEDMGISL